MAEGSSRYWRSSVARCVLKAVPQVVCNELLNDPIFLREYDVRADPTLIFGDDLKVQRSDLYGAIRSVLSGSQAAYVMDGQGRKCRIAPIDAGRDMGGVVLSFGSSVFELSDHGILSENRDARLGCFDTLSRALNLPHESTSSWRRIMAKRPLLDGEVYELMLDLADTVVRRRQEIQETVVRDRNFGIATLVPRSRRYFERLVGTYDGSTSVHDYARGAGRRHIQEMLGWDPYQGLLNSLLLSSHPTLVDEIDVGRMNASDVMSCLRQVDREGDPLSRIGAIEIGFRVLGTMPDVEPVLVRLIERMRDDDGHGPSSGMRFMSSLFMLVDGELSRVRLFSDRPAFYRRMAAMGHAALLYRIFGDASEKIGGLGDWMMQNCGWRFAVQTLIDLRTESRWSLDLAGPTWVRAEFLSRIVAGAQTIIQDIRSPGLRQLVDVSHPKSVCRGLYWYQLCSPGPLEGTDRSKERVLVDIVKEIDEGLAANPTNPAVYVGLGYLARIADVTSQIESLKRRLEDENFRFSEAPPRGAVSLAMHGLATVSAVTRNAAIGDRIRLLVHQYRHDARNRLPVEEAVAIVLAAAASRSELEEWMDYVGGTLTELAFGELRDDEGDVLQDWLRAICDIVPELWRFCGRADAALAAYNGKLT